MDEDLGYLPESSYSSLYNSINVEFGDVEYDAHFATTMDLSDISFISMPTNFPPQVWTPVNDASYTQNNQYLTAGNTSGSQRQQYAPQLQIVTQLSPCSVNDSTSSTTSGSSFPSSLQTPYFQQYSALPPPVHISSPMSAPVDGTMPMLGLEKKSPFPTSPASYHSPDSKGDILDDPIFSLPAEPDIVRQLPMPHILEWKKVKERCGTNDFVPQKVYQPNTEADRKRYIRDVDLLETILFQLDDSSELGILLDDALKQRLKHLSGKDDPMFVGCGPSVSIRIQWPGYEQWSKQIPTMDFKNPKGPITRAKLAKNIAACVHRFAKTVQGKPMEAESDPSWKIGKRHIKVEDLILVSLHHVSKGSWQPQLRLRSQPAARLYQWPTSFPSFPVS